jgi:F420H(2)-dependent quinone reductase
MSVEHHPSKTQARSNAGVSGYVKRFTNRLVIMLYRLTGGAMGGRMQNMSVLLLTTTGRKSGKQYTTPLLYRPENDRLLVVASNGGSGKLPNWWLNVRSGTPVHIEIGRTHQQVRARQADGEERQRFWPLLVADYPGYEKYQQRTAYPIPVVILSPTQGEQTEA